MNGSGTTLRCRAFPGLLLAITVVACSRTPKLPAEENAIPSDGLEVVIIDVGAARRTIDLTLPITPGTDSMLVSIALDDPITGLALTRLVAPDGVVWHDEVDDIFDSRIAGTSFSSIGELAVYLPLSPEQPLQAGDWQARFRLDERVSVRRAAILTRERDDDASKPLRIDMAVGIAATDSRLTDEPSARSVVATWRRVMNQTLAPHDLAIGRIDLLRNDILADYATLDPDADQASDGCRTLAALTDSPLVFKVLLIDRFESVDPESIDGTLGLSPQPGTLFDPGSSESCAFVALEPFFGERTRSEDLDEQLGATLLHEAGHFMGLDHTSEADGQVFDRLGDTHDCRIDDVDGRDNAEFAVAGEQDGVIDDFECGSEGGASNLMFWSGVREYAPFVLSEGQAWVLRRHPLFR